MVHPEWDVDAALFFRRGRRCTSVCIVLQIDESKLCQLRCPQRVVENNAFVLFFVLEFCLFAFPVVAISPFPILILSLLVVVFALLPLPTFPFLPNFHFSSPFFPFPLPLPFCIADPTGWLNCHGLGPFPFQSLFCHVDFCSFPCSTPNFSFPTFCLAFAIRVLCPWVFPKGLPMFCAFAIVCIIVSTFKKWTVSVLISITFTFSCVCSLNCCNKILQSGSSWIVFFHWPLSFVLVPSFQLGHDCAVDHSFHYIF